MDRELNFYHWGQPESTVSKYGFDIRCEVMQLSKNIKIIGSQDNDWGTTITNADILELSNDFTTLIKRNGQMILDNVEIINGG